MDLTALLLSRIQFGSTVAFHIIFPPFGFAAGSLLAAFMQGLTVGALVAGLSIANGNTPAANSAGSARLRGSVASACALAIRCSAPAGWSGMRRRCPRGSLPSDPLSVGWTACLPDRRLCLCLDRESSGHRPMAGASLFVCLPGNRCHRGTPAGRQCPTASERAAVIGLRCDRSRHRSRQGYPLRRGCGRRTNGVHFHRNKFTDVNSFDGAAVRHHRSSP